MIHVEQTAHIPNLAYLALEYGTISQDQYKHLLSLFSLKEEQGDIGDLLFDQGMVTQYQLELLRLIQEYHIVRKRGEEFGKIAIEKGLASLADIRQALKLQKTEFKKSRHKKLIGDILVEARIITSKQKNEILKAQGLFNKDAPNLPNKEERIFKNKETDGDSDPQSPISIVVSADQMTAWIERRKPDEVEIKVSQVKDASAQHGIVNGVYSDSIIQCFLDAGVKYFPIASVDSFNLLKRQSILALHILDDNNEPVEKRKGEILTEQTGAVIKVQIENLYGVTTNTLEANDFLVHCGENTRWSKDKLKILAVKSGVPALSIARSLFVHPIVHVLEDVDQRYGPVEPYANLSVSGTVTGAFPITAGKVDAGEIRGSVIDAIGNVQARVGITGAIIRAQGDVHARYIHNSRIETFGNVYVQNEIIDSQIRCSGKLDSPQCRVIASRIYAKCGVVLFGVGSDRSTPSTIIVGGEHHTVGLAQTILDNINLIRSDLEDLKDEKSNQQSRAEKVFKKMLELKALHDKAKKKKDLLFCKLNKSQKDSALKNLDEKTLKNIKKLILIYEKRVAGSLATLKKMNLSKKEHDDSVEELKEKIQKFSAWMEKEIISHEKTLFAYMEKSKGRIGVALIEIKGKAYFGTNLGGVYKDLTLTDDIIRFKIEELWHQGKPPELKFK